MKIVVDAMGGDNGSGIVVQAVKDFLKENKNVEIAVVGRQDELKDLDGICRVVHADDVIPMEAGALEAMRMKNSSMMVAIRLMKDEGFDGIVSCGSTGGFLSASAIVLKMIEGVKRAALVAPFPTQIKGKKVVILDIGANNENSSEELLQFGKMGRLYSQAVYGVEQPNVYLLSNGTESEKGSPVVKKAHQLFVETNFPGFMGNVEARNVLNGLADVVVCDGFSGNVFLKGCEGLAKFFSKSIKDIFKKNLWTKLGYLHVRKGVKEFSQVMDYKSTGGAMLLGVNGAVVKAHGNSDPYSFKCALNVCLKLIEGHVVEKIKEGMKSDGEPMQ